MNVLKKNNMQKHASCNDGFFGEEHRLLDNVVPQRIIGEVIQIVGLIIECRGLAVPLGSICEVYPAQGSGVVRAEVVGFRDNCTLLMPLGEVGGISMHDRVCCVSRQQRVRVSDALLGRVLDGTGKPIDGREPIQSGSFREIISTPPRPMTRPRITEALGTGIKCLDGLKTCGKGQRMGIFSGSGVGKSVLMGMIARGTSAQISVIALIGERGREVKEFIQKDLGEEGMARSVVVVSTSDEPALVRIRAAFLAITIAEYFRDQGNDVLFMMDSVTRLAMALREIGLSSGEPPTTKGYPPSVFSVLPRFLERSGQAAKGSITGFYTVLVEADDMNEPIADAVRSIVDGHLWLSRDLAARAHYPSIAVLDSVSRLMPEVSTQQHRHAAQKIISLLAAYKEAEDLINIGAYVKGSNPTIDTAIKYMPLINGFLRQDMQELCALEDSVKDVLRIVTEIEGAAKAPVVAKAGVK